VGVYVLARMLFSKETALLTLLIFGFSPSFIWQSFMMWQPYVMQPFAIASYILLCLSYQKRSLWLLWSSIALALIAMTFHYSMLGIAPGFLAVAVTILFSLHSRKKDYLQTFWITLVALVTLYAPAIFFILRNDVGGKSSLIFSVFHTVTISIPKVLSNLVDRLYMLFHYLFYDETMVIFGDYNIYLTLFMVGLVAAVATYFFLGKKNKDDQYMHTKILVLVILSFLFISSITDGDFFVRYLTPIMSLFVILIAELIHKIGTYNKTTFIVKVGLVIGLLYSIQAATPNWIKESYRRLPEVVTKISTAFASDNHMNSMTRAVAEEIRGLATNEKDLFFFDFTAYTGKIGFRGDKAF